MPLWGQAGPLRPASHSPPPGRGVPRLLRSKASNRPGLWRPALTYGAGPQVSFTPNPSLGQGRARPHFFFYLVLNEQAGASPTPSRSLGGVRPGCSQPKGRARVSLSHGRSLSGMSPDCSPPKRRAHVRLSRGRSPGGMRLGCSRSKGRARISISRGRPLSGAIRAQVRDLPCSSQCCPPRSWMSA